MEEELITTDDTIKKVDGAFDSLEELRAINLTKTQSLQAVNNRTLEKEQVRLTKKYGASHSRVQSINNRVAYNQEQKVALSHEVEQSKIKVETNQPDTYLVHGLVVDKDGKGVKDMTISLYRENGKWVRDLGHICTDERGYFALKASAEMTKEYKNQDLFLTITDKDGKYICQDTEPVLIIAGRQDYRVLVLGSGKCPPPPEDNGGENRPPPEPGPTPTPTPEPTVTPTPTPTEPFVLTGRITDRTGKPAPKLIVQPRSKTGVVEEFLKATGTNSKGLFSLKLDPKKLPKLFDGKTEVFLEIFTANKKLIHRTDAVRIEAGKEVEVSIAVR